MLLASFSLPNLCPAQSSSTYRAAERKDYEVGKKHRTQVARRARLLLSQFCRAVSLSVCTSGIRHTFTHFPSLQTKAQLREAAEKKKAQREEDELKALREAQAFKAR